MRAAISTVMGQGKTAETYTLGAGDPCMCGLWRRQNIDDTRQSAQSARWAKADEVLVLVVGEDPVKSWVVEEHTTRSVYVCGGAMREANHTPARRLLLCDDNNNAISTTSSPRSWQKSGTTQHDQRFNSSDDVSLTSARGHETGVMRSRSTTPAMRWAVRFRSSGSTIWTIWCYHVNDAHDGAFRRASPVKAQGGEGRL
ncbi:hypothetical protein THAOC_11956 [Thalassiosira oceanica]|uniref:Uncharacterized protein n=1 Tax=Thalassiosira oceanica TaxID=159749 RepID=K0SL41_THAOC|nr:hypothetical protein THAOC_11956 [Thalassiosira oceanica]|eukprot:EJK67058.1 hypothetical protein THAOC_11956 [Thalassiosira oceanica]